MSRPDILTHSGQYFDFLNPERYNLVIEDVAHGLSNICRFTGQCLEFYSVAQHSVLLSYIVDSEIALEGLLHDSAEAFLGDVSRPLKKLLPDYRAIEERCERAIFTKLGIGWPVPPKIKHADMQMLHIEQRALMAPHDDRWECDYFPLPKGITIWRESCLPPEEAFVAFMCRYQELVERRA